jgi:cbb3-type cytochrome oxidase subunit 3
MKLSDIMAAAGLSFYAQVALVLFLIVFIAIAIRTFLPSRRQELDEASRLPLDDGPVLRPSLQER